MIFKKIFDGLFLRRNLGREVRKQEREDMERERVKERGKRKRKNSIIETGDT